MIQAGRVMDIKSLFSFGCACLALISINANAALIPKLGGAVVYDDVLDLTWLANANLAASNTFSVSNIGIDGEMTWVTADSWITAMNNESYLGFNGWRLPTTLSLVPGESEMGNLFYNEGVTGPFIDGVTNIANQQLFSNIQSDYYWSGTEYTPDTSKAWRFSFADGDQDAQLKSSIVFKHHAWAVHDGDIGAVPVPAAAWLFASGLLGLIGFTRRKR